jgi:hypothetical protein
LGAAAWTSPLPRGSSQSDPRSSVRPLFRDSTFSNDSLSTRRVLCIQHCTAQKHHHTQHARNQARSKRKRSRQLKRESSFDLLCGMHAHIYLQTMLNERKKRLRNRRHA